MTDGLHIVGKMRFQPISDLHVHTNFITEVLLNDITL